ncbi:UNVERIFIED_CONTAM: hypothetical protein GTU68_042963, partial [Idotea baltica]|nr:hypothetical protein [Idotea baltica]
MQKDLNAFTWKNARHARAYLHTHHEGNSAQGRRSAAAQDRAREGEGRVSAGGVERGLCEGG